MAIEFTSESIADVDENTTASIYTAQVTDSNADGGSITFSLGENSDSGLSIDPTTGEVSVVGDIDYETKSSYSFTVVATNEAGETSEIQVTINVANLDEAEPVITSSELASVNEGVGADQVVYTATATDANDVSGGVSYSLSADSDSALSINASTGQVTLADAPDSGTKDSYTFTVVATDAAGNASSLGVTLRVNNLISGTAGNDSLVNTTSNDVVTAGAGSDVVTYGGD